MHRLLLFLALVTATAQFASAEKKIGTSRVYFSAELKGFDLPVTEQHELSLTEAWQYPTRTYFRSFLAGRFPWSQDPEVLLMLPLAAFFPVLYSSTQVARFFGADAHV